MKLYKLILLFSFASGCISSNVLDSSTSLSSKKSVIAIHSDGLSYSEKEALIILPGFGDSKKGRRHQKNILRMWVMIYIYQTILIEDHMQVQ